MSHRGKSLGGLNIHEAPGGAKSSPSGKASRLDGAMARYLRRAMRCGLSRDEALSMLNVDYGMARKVARHPEQLAAVTARAAVAIEAVVLVVNARRARRAA
jgi:hypothetical protein